MSDHLFAHTDSARSTCVASPHCRPAADILRALGLPLTLACRWAHLGPISRKATPIHMHGSPSVQHGGGGGVRKCDTQRVATWPQHRTYVGYSLDLFGLVERPPVQAQYVGSLGLWIVAANAFRRPDGPYVTWKSRLDAPCDLGFHFTTARPGAAALTDAERCADLIFGRSTRTGRPRRRLTETMREVAERAEALKREHPDLADWAVALKLGMSPATLRRHRSAYRREQATGRDGYLPLFYGGDGP